MLRNGNYIVSGITILKDINVATKALEVAFEGMDEKAILYGMFEEYSNFIDHEVTVEFRDELYDGEIRKHVVKVTEFTRIAVIDAEKDFKLFSNTVVNNGSNVVFRDLEPDTYHEDLVVYCVRHEYTGNNQRDWAVLDILDRDRKLSKLRLFHPDVKSSNFAGNYIQFSGRFNNFGFNSEYVMPLGDLHLELNPAFELANTYITKTLMETDRELLRFMESKDYLGALSRYKYEDREEVGSPLIKLAMEMTIARSMLNTTPDIDIKLLTRALVCEYGYCLKNEPNQVYSKELSNIFSILGSSIVTKQLIVILERKLSSIKLVESVVIDQVKQLADANFNASTKLDYVLSNDKMWR